MPGSSFFLFILHSPRRPLEVMFCDPRSDSRIFEQISYPVRLPAAGEKIRQIVALVLPFIDFNLDFPSLFHAYQKKPHQPVMEVASIE